MLIEICKSKIANGVVTEADLHYEGSITIDESLIEAVDILPGEKVEVLNINKIGHFNWILRLEKMVIISNHFTNR